MKKACFSILILSLLLAILTACGTQARQPDEPEPAPQADQTEPTQPEQPAQPAPEPIADNQPIAEPETVTGVEPEPEPEPEPAPENPLTFEDCDETVYAISTVNLRSGPGTDYEKVGSLSTGDSVTRVGIGMGAAENWSQIQLSDGTLVCVSSKYLSTTKPAAQAPGTPGSGGGSSQTSTPSGGSSEDANRHWAESRGQGLAALLEYDGGVQFEDEAAAKGRHNDPSVRVSMK